MKTAWILGASLAIASFCAAAGAAAGPDNKATAETLVNQCASIKTGDRVLITGRASDLELLEEVAINVRKLGAFPLISVGNEKLSRRMLDETPAKFDTQTDELELKLANSITAMIGVQATDNPGLFADVPPARTAARAKAGQPIQQAMYKNNVRMVMLGNGLYPTAATAKTFGISQDQLATVFWAGVNTDYSKLQNTGETVRAALSSAKEAHLTNPNGTDLKFSLAGRQTFVSDGIISADDRAKGGPACQVWLPAGEVYSTPVAGSAEGTVVVDRYVFQGQDITGLKLTFKAGKCTDMSAKGGPIDKLKAQYAAATPGKDALALIDVGINEGMKLPKESKLLAWMPAGMVTIGLGGNAWAGGDNNSSFFLPGFLPGSTLTLDGKALVENGALKK